MKVCCRTSVSWGFSFRLQWVQQHRRETHVVEYYFSALSSVLWVVIPSFQSSGQLIRSYYSGRACLLHRRWTFVLLLYLVALVMRPIKRLVLSFISVIKEAFQIMCLWLRLCEKIKLVTWALIIKPAKCGAVSFRSQSYVGNIKYKVCSHVTARVSTRNECHDSLSWLSVGLGVKR